MPYGILYHLLISQHSMILSSTFGIWSFDRDSCAYVSLLHQGTERSCWDSIYSATFRKSAWRLFAETHAKFAVP